MFCSVALHLQYNLTYGLMQVNTMSSFKCSSKYFILEVFKINQSLIVYHSSGKIDLAQIKADFVHCLDNTIVVR